LASQSIASAATVGSADEEHAGCKPLTCNPKPKRPGLASLSKLSATGLHCFSCGPGALPLTMERRRSAGLGSLLGSTPQMPSCSPKPAKEEDGCLCSELALLEEPPPASGPPCSDRISFTLDTLRSVGQRLTFLAAPESAACLLADPISGAKAWSCLPGWLGGGA